MAPSSTASLIAVRDRREQVIAALTEHFTGDHLDVDEFDARVDRAHTALTVADLDALLADLPALAVTAPAAKAATQALVVRDDPSRPAEKGMWMVMGGMEKKGRWVVPRKMRVRCFWGGGILDFRDADFGPGVTELHVIAVMGGLEVIVPPNLAVDADASAIMGGVDHRHRAPAEPDPGRPVLRITGLVVMGGVSIETRLAGESGRDARRREKSERKALRKGEVARLTAGKKDD